MNRENPNATLLDHNRMGTVDKRQGPAVRSTKPQRFQRKRYRWPQAVLAVAATFTIALPQAAFTEDTPRVTNDSPPNSRPAIEITKSGASWDNLSELFFGGAMATPFSEGAVFVMRGDLRNTGRRPVRYVLLRYELLDQAGKVLLDVEGYNRGAEDMRADEDGATHPEKVKPIPAGGVDSYRMVFFHDEVPRFVSQRVRVIEIREDTASKDTASKDTASKDTASGGTARTAAAPEETK